MRIFNWVISLIAPLCIFITPVFAESIGSALCVLHDVKGEISQTIRPLVSGDHVIREEVIAAATDSLAELQLKDNSKVAVGPYQFGLDSGGDLE